MFGLSNRLCRQLALKPHRRLLFAAFIEKRFFAEIPTSNDNNKTSAGAPDEFYNADVDEEAQWQDLIHRKIGSQQGVEYYDPPVQEFNIASAIRKYGLSAVQLKVGVSKDDADTIVTRFAKRLQPNVQNTLRGYLLHGFNTTEIFDPAVDVALKEMLLQTLSSDLSTSLVNKLNYSVDYRHMKSPPPKSTGTKEPQVLTNDVFFKAAEYSRRPRDPATGRNIRVQPDEPLIRKLESRLITKNNVKMCTGKKQQSSNRTLTCHVVDLRTVNYSNIRELARFLGPTAQILSRKHTGMCARCQRITSKVIKCSRHSAFLPYQNEPLYLDMRRYDVTKICMDSVDGSESFSSKSF